jgi:hypothetical protein
LAEHPEPTARPILERQQKQCPKEYLKEYLKEYPDNQLRTLQ